MAYIVALISFEPVPEAQNGEETHGWRWQTTSSTQGVRASPAGSKEGLCKKRTPIFITFSGHFGFAIQFLLKLESFCGSKRSISAQGAQWTWGWGPEIWHKNKNLELLQVPNVLDVSKMWPHPSRMCFLIFLMQPQEYRQYFYDSCFGKPVFWKVFGFRLFFRKKSMKIRTTLLKIWVIFLVRASTLVFAGGQCHRPLVPAEATSEAGNRGFS